MEKAPLPKDPPSWEGYRYHGSLVLTFPTPEEFRTSIETAPCLTLQPISAAGKTKKAISLYISGLQNLYRGEQPIPETVEAGIHTLPPGRYRLSLLWNGDKVHRTATPIEVTITAGRETRQPLTLVQGVAQ